MNGENKCSENALIASVNFSDRRLGFFEKGESVSLDIKLSKEIAEDQRLLLEVVNGWGRLVMREEIVLQAGDCRAVKMLGSFPLGWYRITLKKAGEDVVLNEYLAFVVVVPMADRAARNSTIAADVAAEYSPETMALGEEFVNTIKLQGIDFIRERSDIRKWDDTCLNYRKQIKEAGIQVISTSTNHRASMPSIKEMDLLNIYDLYKNGPSLNEITNEIYEMQNEPDLTHGSPALPDTLTAYTKAAMIGLSDSGYDPLLAMSGLAFATDTIYCDLLLQNGILDYSSLFNFHGYGGVEGKASYVRKVLLAYSPKNDIGSSYMTENGYKVWADKDGVAYFDQLTNMCRYAIKSSAKILAEGCDKWFWFIARAFLELGGGFGNLHAWTHQPYPIAATLANLTYQLGDGRYIGRLSHVSEGSFGLVFDRGEHDVVVLFGKDGGSVEIKTDRAVKIDMFGEESELLCDENGMIFIAVSNDPVFLRFDGRLAATEYYRSDFEVLECKRRIFDKAHRVVLNAVWMDQNLMDSMIMQKGYLLAEQDRQRVALRVYNFNNETVKGRVHVSAEYPEQFDISIENPEFIIEPFGKTEIEVVITTTGKATMNSSGDICFAATLSDGGEIPVAVSRYWFKLDDMQIDDKDIVRFKDFDKEENWNLKNIDAPGSITMTSNAEEKSITLKADHGGGYAQWFFPEYFVQNPEIFDGADGVVLRRKHSHNVKTKFTIFVCTKDGRGYWSGESSGVAFDDKLKTIVYPWNTFMLFASPEGFNDPRPFDPKDIYMVRVGASGTPKDFIPDTTIKDFGIFYDRSNATCVHPGKILFEGIEEGCTYHDAKGLKLTATLPEDVIGDVRVMLGKQKFDKWTMENNTLKIDLSDLGRGEHVIQVSGKTAMNYRYIRFVTFYVEE